LATGVIAALAIAAPVAEASATTIEIPMPDTVSLPFDLSFTEPATGGLVLAHAGLAVNDTFNGGTVVVVSTSPAEGNTIASP
jgi:hypothetical protein